MISNTLLHIDDDPTFTSLITRVLATHGWDVDSLNDPAQWCDAISQHRIVLLDMNMPGYPGIEVLRDIKRFDRTLQVIVVTAVCTLTTVVSCLSSGAEYCFFKPMDGFEPLVDSLERTRFKIEHWQDAAASVARQRATARKRTR
ncbi:MAG: response regulator [Planctomycetes bacterium]|nr:response regulator [Planctomycetota bacterium]